MRDDLPQSVRSSVVTDELLLGTVEPQDLPECIDLMTAAFYKDILTLASDEFR